MKDVHFIQSEWKKMRDGIGDLIGLGRWGKGMIDTLKDLTKNLEDAESDIRKYDSDGVISFQHTNQKNKYQALFEDFKVMHSFSGKVDDIVDRTIDDRFYKDIDAYVEGMRNVTISQYKTKNHIGAIQTIHYQSQTYEINKKEVTIDDLLSGDNYYGEQIRLEFEAWKRLNPDQDFTQEEYQLVAINSRAFEYTSIRDQQVNKEFWFNIAALVVIVGTTLVCPPAGIGLGIAYGTYELSSAVAGKDLVSGRELGTGERWFRGLLSPLDIVPGAAAVKKFSGAARTMNFGLDTGMLGTKMTLKQGLQSSVSHVRDMAILASKQSATRLRNFAEATADAARVVKNKLAKEMAEAGELASKVASKIPLPNVRVELVTEMGGMQFAMKHTPEGMVSKVDGVRAGKVTEGAGEVIEQIDGIKVVNGKVGGKIPIEDFKRIRVDSVKNSDSKSLTLGKYTPTIENGKQNWDRPGPDSYIAKAGKESSYFDLGNDWNKIKENYNLTDDDMFELFNIPVLDDAVASGKQIRFSHDPTKREYRRSYLFKEWKYLKDRYGFRRLEKEGTMWIAK